MNERVRFEVREQIAYVTMARTDKYNALDWEMFVGLIGAAKKISRDKSIRAVILKGDGKAFCSGLDFPSFAKQQGRMVQGFLTYGVKTTNIFQEVAWCWRRLPVPVIAVIHGYCYGGGLQIALGADFRFSTPDCEFSILEAKWGLIPDMSGTVTLRELLPMDQAKLLAMTGRMLNGEEALKLNMVTAVSADPLAEAEKLAAEIKTRSPDSVASTKELFQDNWVNGVRSAFRRERYLQLGLLFGKNRFIAQEANFKKQKPDFLPRK
jgi:enoyl-CoA hydratase/carnithine racemase